MNSRYLFFIIFSLFMFPAFTRSKVIERNTEASDSLRKDTLNRALTPYYIYSPNWSGYDYNFFPIHQGFNTLLSLDATIGLGSHHPSGVGFGRHVNFIYASPVKNQLSYTLAMNTSQMDWSGYHYNQAGVGGSLNYTVNDKISLSLSGYKDFIHPQQNLFRQYPQLNNYIGGAVNMKFADNVFLQVSFGTSTFSY